MWKPVDPDLWRHNAQNGCSLQQQCVWKQSHPMKRLDTLVAKGKCHHNVTGVSGTQFQQCWHSRCANVMSWHYWTILVGRGPGPKSGTGHADAVGFRGHINVMHWNNSSLQLGNKMTKLCNIDSFHETLIHIANHGFACSICAQIIQRILWCCNRFCDFHWNHIQRILCSSGAIRLPAGDIRDDLRQISHWIGQNPGVRNITIFKNFNQFTLVSFSVFLITVHLMTLR